MPERTGSKYRGWTHPLFNAIIQARKDLKMSIKLVMLKSGEQLIAEAKELVNDEKEVKGYLLDKPHKVITNTPLLLTEEQSNDSSVEVTLSPWILLSEDQEVVVQPDWVITVVQPLPSVIKMYKEKLKNGQSN